MEKRTFIIITGLPGTGKTTLGRKLAKELQLPFICKDDIKELLFDGLGWKDREWSKKIGGASYDMLYYVTELLLKAEKSLIIETNFNPEFANQKLLELKEKYHFAPVQIRCFADGEVLFERFKQRAKSTDRHPGHVDGGSLEEFRPILLQGKIEALSMGGETLDVDTTDFDTVDYEKIVSVIKSAINIK